MTAHFIDINTPSLARAPGKIILVGEYAVLEGYPGLVASIDRSVTVHMTPSETCAIKYGNTLHQVSTQNNTIKIDQNEPELELIEQILLEALEQDLSLPRATILVDSSQLFFDVTTNKTKFGLGSSGAIAAALSYQILALNNKTPSPSDVFSLAFAAHRRFSRGIGSGIDVAASCYGGVIRFVPTPKGLPYIERVRLGFDVNCIVAVFTGHAQSTRSFLAKIWQAKTDHHTQYKTIMADLGTASRHVAEALLASQQTLTNWLRLGAAIEQHSTQLKLLGELADIEIISASHRAIADIARQHQGLAKPSGAGGGDIALCFIENSRQAAFEHDIAKAGYYLLPIAIQTSPSPLTTSL